MNTVIIIFYVIRNTYLRVIYTFVISMNNIKSILTRTMEYIYKCKIHFVFGYFLQKINAVKYRSFKNHSKLTMRRGKRKEKKNKEPDSFS